MIGYEAGKSVTSGHEHVFIGYQAGRAKNVNNQCTYVGFKAGAIETGLWGNTFLGAYAGANCSTGNGMTFVGGSAGYNNTGGCNDAFGYQALNANTGSLNNVAIGAYSMKYQNSNSTDSYNVAIGHTAFGGSTFTSLNHCIGIGAEVEASSASAEEQIVIGFRVVGAGNNTFTFGTGGSDTKCNFGGTTWSNPSDARYKENVEDQTAGLSFINDLRPVTFDWKKEKDLPPLHRAYVKNSEKKVMNDNTNHGFLAQEVKEVINKHPEIKDGFDMWSQDEADGRQRIGQTALIPILTKAIQELSAEVEELKEKVNGNN